MNGSSDRVGAENAKHSQVMDYLKSHNRELSQKIDRCVQQEMRQKALGREKGGEMSDFIESKVKGSGVKDILKLKTIDLEGSKRALAELIYQLSALYDRWSVEHQQVARREAEFARILSEFSKQVELTGELGREIQSNIQATTARAAALVGDRMDKEAMKEFNKGVSFLQQELSKTIYNAGDLLMRYEHSHQQEHLKSWVRVIGVGVLVGALVGLGTAWLYNFLLPTNF